MLLTNKNRGFIDFVMENNRPIYAENISFVRQGLCHIFAKFIAVISNYVCICGTYERKKLSKLLQSLTLQTSILKVPDLNLGRGIDCRNWLQIFVVVLILYMQIQSQYLELRRILYFHAFYILSISLFNYRLHK